MLPALLAAALLHPPAEAARRSTVFVGDFAPEDRSSIDAFCRRYDRLDGDLVIGARFRGQDLQHLGCLVSLTGEVRIEGAPLIRNLDGIEAFAGKEGLDLAAIRIRDTPSLHDLSALSRIGDAGVRDIEIQGNLALTEVGSLPPLLPGGAVEITDNPKLKRVRLPDATVPHARLDQVVLRRNPALETASGLGRVVELGRLQLDGLPLLDDASLAPGLRAVDTLSLTDLPKLTDLPSWPDLALVDRWIVRDVDAIRALPDLPDLSRVKELVITRNDRLEEIGGLATNRTSSPTFYGVQITDNPWLAAAEVDVALRRVQTFRGGASWVVRGNGAALRAQRREQREADAPDGLRR